MILILTVVLVETNAKFKTPIIDVKTTKMKLEFYF